MAKRGRKRRSVSGYFRKVFQERPEWLHQTSNDAVLARWRADHNLPPDAPVPPKVRANLANLKSVLRRAERAGGGSPTAAVGVGARSAVRLDTLEEMIDDCLTLAKTLDRTGLDHVIGLLRRARNQVVWKLGEK